jgi:hypothetical protein
MAVPTELVREDRRFRHRPAEVRSDLAETIRHAFLGGHRTTPYKGFAHSLALYARAVDNERTPEDPILGTLLL